MTMKAFMSPIGVGWMDWSEDLFRGHIGEDYAAQVEAANIVAVTEPWPMAAIPISCLDPEAKAALAGATLKLIVVLPGPGPEPRKFSREWREERGIVPPDF